MVNCCVHISCIIALSMTHGKDMNKNKQLKGDDPVPDESARNPLTSKFA